MYRTLLFTFAAVTLIAAGVSANGGDDARNSLYDGARALQFEVVGDLFNLDFTSFQGSTISYKWHTSDRSAIRLGLTVSGSLQDRTQERSLNDSLLYERELDEKRYNLSVNAQKVWYAGQPDRLAMFYGVGPLFSYQYVENTTVDEQNDVRNEQSRTDVGGGMTFVLGAEWFPVHDISLLLEYRTDAQYLHQTTESINGTVTATSESDVFRVDASHVRLGLTVYF